MILKARFRVFPAQLEERSCSKMSAPSPRSLICCGSPNESGRKNKINDDLLRPVFQTSRWFHVIVVLLGVIVLAGLGSWLYQMWFGLVVAGIKWPVYWAFYVTNFVFWIGISHAGTLISAILRLVNATWRRPVTRCAEVITVFALMIGAMFPIIHLGRPWLV